MKLKKVINKLKRKTRNINSTKEISYENLKKLLKSNSNVTVLDVRSPQEFAENRINSAINIPVYDIPYKATASLINKDNTIVVYCQSGTRSKKACAILEKLGYTNLYNLTGGLNNI